MNKNLQFDFLADKVQSTITIRREFQCGRQLAWDCHTKHELLEQWFDGWSLCLDEMNHARTGFRRGGLLDVYYVSNEEVARKVGYGAKIGVVNDAARPLEMKGK